MDEDEEGKLYGFAPDVTPVKPKRLSQPRRAMDGDRLLEERKKHGEALGCKNKRRKNKGKEELADKMRKQAQMEEYAWRGKKT